MRHQWCLIALLALLAWLLVAATGCNTVVGNYLGNRASDFGDCFRAEARVLSLGVDVKAAGIARTGLYTDFRGARAALGWNYGQFVACRGGGAPPAPSRHYVIGLLAFDYPMQGDAMDPPVYSMEPFMAGAATLQLKPLPGTPYDKSTFVKNPWKKGGSRWHRIHAFDVEVGVGLFVGLRLGFSIGEFVDFLTGWFGADIAQDDRPLALLDDG